MERGIKLREIEPDERFDALDPLVWRKVELSDYWKMEEANAPQTATYHLNWLRDWLGAGNYILGPRQFIWQSKPQSALPG